MIKQYENTMNPFTKFGMMFHGIIYDEIAMRNLVCVECLKQIEHLQFICTNFCIRKKIGKCAYCFLFQQHTANFSKM